MTVRDRLAPPRTRRTVARVPARGRMPDTSENPAEACVPPTAEPFPPPPIHVPGTATNRIPPSQGKRPAMLSPSTSTPRRARRSLVPRLVSLGRLTNPIMGTFPLDLLSCFAISVADRLAAALKTLDSRTFPQPPCPAHAASQSNRVFAVSILRTALSATRRRARSGWGRSADAMCLWALRPRSTDLTAG